MASSRSRILMVLILAGGFVGLSGCRHYQWGTLMHPQVGSLAVGTFANKTMDASCAALLRGRLAEAVSREPGVVLLPPDQADAIIEGTIVSVRQRRLARAEVRHERERENDSDAYQSVLYRLEITLEYRVRIADSEKMLIEKRKVVGTTDLGRWPDQQVMRSDALGRALGDAAERMVASITEAW